MVGLRLLTVLSPRYKRLQQNNIDTWKTRLPRISSASTFPKINREVESLLGVVVRTAVERAIRAEDGADRKIEAIVRKRLEAIRAMGTATV